MIENKLRAIEQRPEDIAVTPLLIAVAFEILLHPGDFLGSCRTGEYPQVQRLNHLFRRAARLHHRSDNAIDVVRVGIVHQPEYLRNTMTIFFRDASIVVCFGMEEVAELFPRSTATFALGLHPWPDDQHCLLDRDSAPPAANRTAYPLTSP
jgi:hypothetical protein